MCDGGCRIHLAIQFSIWKQHCKGGLTVGHVDLSIYAVIINIQIAYLKQMNYVKTFEIEMEDATFECVGMCR